MKEHICRIFVLCVCSFVFGVAVGERSDVMLDLHCAGAYAIIKTQIYKFMKKAIYIYEDF